MIKNIEFLHNVNTVFAIEIFVLRQTLESVVGCNWERYYGISDGDIIVKYPQNIYSKIQTKKELISMNELFAKLPSVFDKIDL